MEHQQCYTGSEGMELFVSWKNNRKIAKTLTDTQIDSVYCNIVSWIECEILQEFLGDLKMLPNFRLLCKLSSVHERVDIMAMLWQKYWSHMLSSGS